MKLDGSPYSFCTTSWWGQASSFGKKNVYSNASCMGTLKDFIHEYFARSCIFSGGFGAVNNGGSVSQEEDEEIGHTLPIKFCSTSSSTVDTKIFLIL